jgi:hypothetical protein
MKPWLAIFTVLVAVAGLRAEAVTGSSCTYSEVVNPITMQAPGLTCNLFPSTNTTGGVGTFQGNFVSISLSSVPGWSTGMEQGVGIGDGYLVVTNPGVTLTLNPDTGIFDDSNRADWLQVLEFTPSAGPGLTADGNARTTSLTLWTAGCSGAMQGTDTSCFPSLATMEGANTPAPNMFNGSYFFEVEGTPDPNFPLAWNGTTWSPSYGASFTPSYTLATAPEPATWAMVLGGLALLASVRGKR